MSRKTRRKPAKQGNLSVGLQSGQPSPDRSSRRKATRRDNRFLFAAILGIAVIVVIGVVAYSGYRAATAGQVPNSTPTTVAANIRPTTVAATTTSTRAVPSSSAVSFTDLKDKLAPDFSLTDINDRVYTRDSLKGKNVVLFFTEGLMCFPACWNQIVAFQRDERFKDGDTVALSIVVDAKQEWKDAAKKMPELGQVTVLFDRLAAVSTQYGVLTAKSSMHYGTMPGHTYVLMDRDGIIRNVLDDPAMGVRNDALIVELQKLSPTPP